MISLQTNNMFFKKGLHKDAALNMSGLAIVVATGLKDYGFAYQLSKTAFQLNEKMGNQTLRATINFIYALYIHSWREPARQGINYFLKGHQYGLEAGDLTMAAYCAYAIPMYRLINGDKLDDIWNEISRSVSFIHQRRDKPRSPPTRARRRRSRRSLH